MENIEDHQRNKVVTFKSINEDKNRIKKESCYNILTQAIDDNKRLQYDNNTARIFFHVINDIRQNILSDPRRKT